mgnify:CR=1 FL=1
MGALSLFNRYVMSNELEKISASVSTPGRALIGENTIARTITSGCTSTVYILENKGCRSVLKDARDAHFAEWIEREHNVLAWMSDTGLRVPHVLGFKRSGSSAAILLEYIEGDSVTNLLKRASPVERLRIWRELGAAMRQMHTCPIPAHLPTTSSAHWLAGMLERAQAHLDIGRAAGSSNRRRNR